MDPPGVTGPHDRRKIAAFDFDGTLTRRDTLVPFLALVAGRAKLARVAAQMGLLGVNRKVDLRDRDGIKAGMIRHLLAGRRLDDLTRLGEQFGRDIMASRLDPLVLGRLRAHVSAGHEVVFVSASLIYYLEPIAAELGVAEVIAVEPVVESGVLTGELRHPNVRAEQKAIRLRSWLGERDSGPLEQTELWAYGNSSGDHQLLELAHHRYWLGRPSATPPGATQLTSTETLGEA